MEYPIKISKSKHAKAALSAVNCFLKLTDKELDIIVEILNSKVKVLNTKNRKDLRDRLNTDVYTFNNYIKRLKERGYLINTSNGLALHDNIVNAASDKEVTITFHVHN